LARIYFDLIQNSKSEQINEAVCIQRIRWNSPTISLMEIRHRLRL